MIYLDYNATTPCDERVLNKALPYFSEKFANPSSTTYAAGWQADESVRVARNQVAQLLNVSEREIIFTSGATESINLALKGLVDLYRGAQVDRELHIITCRTEHSAVIAICEYLEKRGVLVTWLDVDKYGLIDIATLEESITEKTILVCIAYANNETGVIQPIEAIGKICKKYKVPFMSDTTQAIGKVICHPRSLGIDIACISGHKMYGMKGTGALYISRKYPMIRINPIIHGGGQQDNLRSGTLNVPGIVALGEASALCMNLENEQHNTRIMRDKLERELLDIKDTVSNVNITTPRLPNTINIAFKKIKAEKLIARINQRVAISLGSACNAGTGKPSKVLQAMGIADEYIHGSVRISIGRYSTEEELTKAASILREEVAAIRTT